jgi:hypothetical protein
MLKTGERWTDREAEKLRHLIATGLDSTEIARQMGRSQAAVKNKAVKMSLNFIGRKVGSKDSHIKFVDFDPDEMRLVNEQASKKHLEDLEKAYPHGLAVIAPAPLKGGPRYFSRQGSNDYRSPAAALVEG